MNRRGFLGGLLALTLMASPVSSQMTTMGVGAGGMGGGSAPPAWTPADASTPALWHIDASNAGSITSGGFGTEATVVADLGTGAKNMTPNGTGPTYTNTVQNGKPCLDFDGGKTLRTAAWFMNQPFMLVVIWKQSGTVPQNFGILLDMDRDSTGTRALIANRRNDDSDRYGIFAGGAVVTHAVTISTSTPYYSRVIFDGADTASRLNASSLTGLSPGTDGSGPNGGLQLGGLSGSGTASNANICEAFIIPYANHAAVLANAPTDDTNAAAYATAKWAIP